MKTEYVQQWLKDTAEYYNEYVYAEIEDQSVSFTEGLFGRYGAGDGSDWEEAAFNFVTNKDSD
jgi:hypothetical protein